MSGELRKRIQESEDFGDTMEVVNEIEQRINNALDMLNRMNGIDSLYLIEDAHDQLFLLSQELQ